MTDRLPSYQATMNIDRDEVYEDWSCTRPERLGAELCQDVPIHQYSDKQHKENTYLARASH
jgi:hypothetical protein